VENVGALCHDDEGSLADRQAFRGNETMQPIRVDKGSLMPWLGQDADFMEYPCQVYLHRETGEVVGVYEQDEDATLAGVAEDENRRRRQEVATGFGVFLEIPIPDHGQRHAWFREFLKTRDQESAYFGSITDWLETYGTDEDWDDWRDFESERVIQHAVQVAEAAGVTIEVA
jgi:hypothetical protein